MNVNHGMSCGCGCQQGKEEYNDYHVSNEYRDENPSTTCNSQQGNYEYEQSKETYNNDYQSYEYNQQNYNTCGRNQGTMEQESMQKDRNWENANYSGYDGCSPNQLNALNLPDESTRFQKITNVNTRDSHRVLDMMDVPSGTRLDTRVPPICSQTEFTNTVSNELVSTNHDTQFLIFYQTDDSSFIIGNRGNGRVLDVFPSNRNGYTIVSNVYSGSRNNQRFRMNKASNNQFSLQTIFKDRVNICGHIHNFNAIITATTLGENDSNALFQVQSSTNITLPTLPPRTTLEPPRALTNINDTGDSPAQAPRAVEGSVLIPAIAVNDVIPVAQRMQESPYYVLTYNTYWHRVISAILPGSGQTTRFDVNLPGPNQSTMVDVLDTAITADFRLQFVGSGRTNVFQQQIRNGLNILNSTTSHRLGDETRNWDFTNRGAQGRLAFFVKAHEFVLTRANGTRVSDPWVALDPNVTAAQTFGGVLLTLEKEKIVCASNSYNLSVWKTPMEIKNGKIYTKNEWNTKPNYK
uniref:Crystal protein ET69 n=1 Tax=Bacillus thuringiensis TaxID=1428 RepID=Q93LQ1_BACTU|nr:crystal protein ET69 [Bacillus thuringiensis]